MQTVTTLASGIDWIVSDAPVDYPDALAWMDSRAAAVSSGEARECIWLLEHPALYTAGTSADPSELRDPRFPVFPAGRGGRYTYHGPGQRIAYLILNLNKRGRDVRSFVHDVESWMIATLAMLGVRSYRSASRIGIWVDDPDLGEAKIGAIGIRVRRWISMHGFSVNLDPELTHFDGIVPCGISGFGVTSMARLQRNVTSATFDQALLMTSTQFLYPQNCNNPLEQQHKKS